MLKDPIKEDVAELVSRLNYAQKVKRSLELIDWAYREHGNQLVVANSLSKDSVAVWNLAKRVNPKIRGFIVTTRFKPPETVIFMNEQVAQYPELKVFRNDQIIPDQLHAIDPDRSCDVLKVEPTRRAIEEMNVSCWMTGLRCTEGQTRTDLKEIEQHDPGLTKLNPILIWYERELWQYLALNHVPVNPLYAKGYKSLGCAPCSKISLRADEQARRWTTASKCGSECNIHTRPLKLSALAR